MTNGVYAKPYLLCVRDQRDRRFSTEAAARKAARTCNGVWRIFHYPTVSGGGHLIASIG